MNLLDLVIVLLGVAAAIGGYRLGFLARGLSWLGLVAGLAVGSRAVPFVLGLFTAGDPPTRMIVGLVTLLVCVGVLASVGETIGLRLRRSVHRTALRPLDQAAGAVAGVLAVVLLVWFLTPAAAEVPGAISRQVRSSRVVAAIGEATPDPPDTIHALRSLIDGSRFPQVFADLRPAPDTGPPPSQIPVSPAIVEQVTASTVNIETRACGARYEGSAWVVADGLVVTNAHVVAGATDVQARTPRGEVLAAEVVSFDDDHDLALVRVPDLTAPALPTTTAEVGMDGATVGYPGGQDQPRTQPVSVRDRRTTIGRDIYSRDTVEREVLFLAADLRQGDSGSPVFDAQGRVVGTVFAVSPDRPSTAYALDISEVQALLDAPRNGGPGPCT